MSSFEERYYLGNASRRQRLLRDWRLCRESLSFLLLWLRDGGRIRRAYRKASEAGKPLALEDLFRGGS